MSQIGLLISWYTSDYILGRDDGVRVRITATEACGMSPKVFAFRMLPLNANTGETNGYFDHICSPVDLAEYPEDEPLAGASPQWFRLDYVDVLLRSWLEAEDFIAGVRSDLRRCVATLNRAQALVFGGQEVAGELCDSGEDSCDSSVSSSSSESGSE